MPVKAGIIIAGNATDMPKSKRSKFLTVDATIWGKNRRKLLIFIAPFLPSRSDELFWYFSFFTSYVDFLLENKIKQNKKSLVQFEHYHQGLFCYKRPRDRKAKLML